MFLWGWKQDFLVGVWHWGVFAHLVGVSWVGLLCLLHFRCVFNGSLCVVLSHGDRSKWLYGWDWGVFFSFNVTQATCN